MFKFKGVKSALITSVVSLFLCVAMLVGTTFAWFTDSVTSAGNVIQSGTLDILFQEYDEENSKWVDVEGSIFNYDKWEPGYTQIVNLRVVNEGTLALKWQATITTEKNLSILADAINVYVKSDDMNDTVKILGDARVDFDAEVAAGTMHKFTLRQFINGFTQMTNGTMQPDQASYLTIALQMDPEAGNEYQGLDLGGKFDLTILATQLAAESDSFNNQYDKDADFGVFTNSATIAAGAASTNIEVRNNDGYKVASVQVPTVALADKAEKIEVIVNNNANENVNVTVAADETAEYFDVKVLGLKENNTDLITVELRIPAGLDPATVKLYHYDNLIPSSYNPHTGYVTFQSATFSPFTVVYEAESEYEAPAVDENKLPVAIVTDYTDIADIKWGNYGQWSPTEGLEANLESAYVFACKETAAEAALNPYANWYCDFYVSLDRALGENQIFLGGNYGSFGWVGFHNGDLTLDANTEIGLLEGVTTNPWTYLDVASYVGTFICGVGDVDDALSGATFTVKLRLTNPEDATEYYDIETINYQFN